VSGKTVAVLGLAYKPSSHVLDESQGVLLAQALSKFGARVVGFDPLAGELAQAELGDQILVLDSIDDCVEQADIVLLTNPDPFFLTLDSEKFRDKTVIDFWRILDKKLSRIPEVRYIPFGRSTRDEANAQRLTVLWNSACGSLQIESLSLARSKDKSVRKAR
jgi:UDPglucose 6-dehydrogenase